MNWSDRGLVLGLRPLGESSVILELMTREHGRHLGLVRGGRSRRAGPVLQPGNTVQAAWRARLDEQLGTYAVEGERLRAARLIGSPLALYGVATLAHHLRLLPERDPHPGLFDVAEELAERLDDAENAPALLARFEVTLLAELGFGLDLVSCAATGQRHDLAYVSPKSGRAVSSAAGEPWRARLLPLPAFLTEAGAGQAPSAGELTSAFRMTGHFLDAHVYGPRGLVAPDERARFVSLAAAGRSRFDVGNVRAELDGRPVSAEDAGP